jgi:tripartite-type tricarboxylate transporter receptor subunit TctC
MSLRWTAIIAAMLWPQIQPAALGQNYPAKPIRMIIAESSGSGADILARQIGGKLTEAWGQSVVVDSRTGASGLIASELVARSAPDGYTIWKARRPGGRTIAGVLRGGAVGAGVREKRQSAGPRRHCRATHDARAGRAVDRGIGAGL